MSMIFRAPYPTMVSTSVLPNPDLGDSENLKNRLDIHRSKTGVKRTYIVRPNTSKFLYNFRLTRFKAAEFEEFVKAYIGYKWLVEDYRGSKLVVTLSNNPFEFTSASSSRPGREIVTISVELEGLPL